MKKHVLYLLLIFIGCCSYGQSIKTSVDTTRNKIGAQFNMTISATVDSTNIVQFPRGDNFGRLQVIRSYVTDTIKQGGQYELIKRYGLTQFDSGRYTVPRLPVLINGRQTFTDSLSLEITAVEVDTLKQKMFEIKPAIEGRSKNGSWWWYILFGVLLTAIAFGIFYILKKRSTKPAEKVIYSSPIEKATSLLKTLESKQLWQRGEIKSYYSELTNIARTYIEEEIHIPAMESTTTELINALREVAGKKKLSISKETMQDLEVVLMQADLVKFAKSRPLDFEIEEDKKRIEKSIVLIHQAVPEELPDEDDVTLELLLREKQLKKQKQKRQRFILFGGVAATVLIIGILLAVKGVSEVKDALFGNPTRELLSGEWVSSEYGHPGIFVETPKVLKRVDAAKSLPQDGMALIKDMQTFTYGGLFEDFQIRLFTLSYKQETQIDLEKGIDGMLQYLEKEGAQNMIVKQEEFQTNEGLSGRKGYGTFSRIDTSNRSSKKYYYEVVLFGQQNGLQSVMIIHAENDEFAKQISERVLESVELTRTMP